MDVNFKIIIPCYNVEQWITNCIKSVYLQTYKNWHCIILNDKSTDSTAKVIEEAIPAEFKSKFTVNNNETNVGAMHNIINGIKQISDDPEDVIALLDGDDWLATKYALEYVNKVYKEGDIWLTYGQYSDVKNNNFGCSAQLTSTHDYRETRWKTSHLRTYKNKIWNKIKDADFRGLDGEYYAMAWDLAIMFPLIEMAGINRIKFIRAVLYKYNNMNPMNDDKKNLKLQMDTDKEIRLKPKYEQLP